MGRHVTRLRNRGTEVVLRQVRAQAAVCQRTSLTMPRSVDRQLFSLTNVCAGACALLALPVLVPVLFALSPILFLAGLIWVALRKRKNSSIEKFADPPLKPSELLGGKNKSVDGAEPPHLPPNTSADSSNSGIQANDANSGNGNNANSSKGSNATMVAPVHASSSASSVKSTKTSTPSPAAPFQAKPSPSSRSESAQPAAAPATGSAALLARIRSAQASCQHAIHANRQFAVVELGL